MKTLFSARANVRRSVRPFDDGEGEPDVASIVQAAVEKATAPLIAKRDELLGEKKKVSEQNSRLSEVLEGLGGEAGIKSLTDFKTKLDGDETLKRIKDGKWQEVFEEKADALRKDHAKQLEALSAERDGFRDQAGAATQKLNHKLLEVDLRRTTAASEGFADGANVDALAQAQQVFNHINEETGVPEIRDAEGIPVLGGDGSTPMTIAEWLEAKKETSSHWWAPSVGANLNGSGPAGGGPSSDLSQITDQAAYEKKRREQGAGKRNIYS